ncbi:Putative F-box/LRR-repeat protein At5g02930 [Linum perenne]
MVRRSKRIQNRIVDRLSDLPDCILHHILSFLDTKSSVQTSILSRRWRSLWKYVDVLTFRKNSFCFNCDFERYVDKVLSLRCDGSRVCKVRTDLKGEELFDRVMKYAASHGVQELFISSRLVGSYVVRTVCLCYQSLKVLELNRILVEENVVELWSCLELLESLTLARCPLNFDCCFTYGDVFANFPRLETLKLDRCFHSIGIGTSVLKVTGSKLLDLEIVFPEFDSLQIVGPQLQSLSLKIGPSFSTTIPEVSKSNLPSLNRANIKLLGKWHMFLDTCSSSGNDYHKQMLLDCCASLFKILHNVQALDLQVVTFELLVETCNLVKRQGSPFKRMKSLSLKHSEESLDGVPDEVISYFLGGSSGEEDKRFTVEHCLESDSSMSDPDEMDPDMLVFLNLQNSQ